MAAKKPSPVVTLLTDFGAVDPFVGILKGVILSIAPRATLVDLTHAIPPQDIYRASLLFASAYAFFPKGTVHLAVVDPGTGGRRRALAIRTRDYIFVGPDNGLFTHALAREKSVRCFALTNPRYFLKNVSPTFHGRDVFAPAAAHLANGTPPTRMGKAIDDPVRLDIAMPVMAGRRLRGRVEYADRFGNLVTNITRDDVTRLGREPLSVILNGKPLGKMTGTYAAVRPGAFAAVWNCDGRLEIAVREGSALQKLKKGPGLSVEVFALR